MEPIFNSKSMGAKITVYQDHIEWSVLSVSKSIPVNQISSVEFPPLLGRIDIITTGGKKYKIPMRSKDRKPLQEAIFSVTGPAQTSQASRSNLDELKKLADLKASGIITEKEFEDQKKKLLQG